MYSMCCSVLGPDHMAHSVSNVSPVSLQAVTHVPKPSVVHFDPNDPNFILGIPEEPVSATGAEAAKDGKKVS